MEFRGHRGRFWISVILIVLVADLALGGFHANGLLLDVVLLIGWWATRQTAVRTVGLVCTNPRSPNCDDMLAPELDVVTPPVPDSMHVPVCAFAK